MPFQTHAFDDHAGPDQTVAAQEVHRPPPSWRQPQTGPSQRRDRAIMRRTAMNLSPGKALISTAALALALAAGAAQAGQAKPKPAPAPAAASLKSLDKNADGVLTVD